MGKGGEQGVRGRGGQKRTSAEEQDSERPAGGAVGVENVLVWADESGVRGRPRALSGLDSDMNAISIMIIIRISTFPLLLIW